MSGRNVLRNGAFVTRVVDSVILTALLVATLGHGGAAISPGPFGSAVARTSVNDSGFELAIDPPSYWMRSGTNATLEALWTSGSPLCRLTPLGFSWTVEPGNATGVLNATTGPSVEFVATSFDSGTVLIEARASAILDCGAEESVITASRAANMTVVTPLSLSGVEVTPNPLLPGETAVLEGGLVGGSPPATLEIAWGDGSHSSLVLPTPGPFSLAHTFPPGDFIPIVTAEDTAGDSASASVDEAVSVGNGLEVGILPARPVAEVGVPVEFSGAAEGGTSGLSPLFDCSDGAAGPATITPNGTAFPCTFTSPGVAEVLFGEYPSMLGGLSASAILYEPVVAPPTLSVGPGTPVEEAGSLGSVRVNVSGGVAPIVLSWNISENGPGGEETVWSDGGGFLPVTFGSAGDYEVGVRGNDTFGSVTASSFLSVRVDPRLSANATAASTLEPYGALAAVAGGVVSGCPPFDWWVVPGLLLGNASVGTGILTVAGGFAWTGAYALEGDLPLTVGVDDGCGATWQADLATILVPPLSANVTVTSGSLSNLELLEVGLWVHGGLPPFQIYVNASDGESWNRTLSSDGTTRWFFPSDGNGALWVSVSVLDALGASGLEVRPVVLISPTNRTVPSPAPPPSTVLEPPNNSTGPAAGSLLWIPAAVALGATVAGLGIVLGRRRKSRSGARDAPGPDPVATLKQIIEPADGAERFTVELLAEEAGIALTDVRSTIDRLIAEKRIRSDSGADGEEVLSWSAETGH